MPSIVSPVGCGVVVVVVVVGVDSGDVILTWLAKTRNQAQSIVTS